MWYIVPYLSRVKRFIRVEQMFHKRRTPGAKKTTSGTRRGPTEGLRQNGSLARACAYYTRACARTYIGVLRWFRGGFPEVFGEFSHKNDVKPFTLRGFLTEKAADIAPAAYIDYFFRFCRRAFFSDCRRLHCVFPL